MKFLNSFAKALIIARAKEKRVAHAMHTIERLHKSQLPLMPRQIQRIPAPRALPTRFPRPIQNQQQMQERQQKMQEQRQEHEIQLKQIQMPQMPRQEQSRQQIIQQSRQEIPKITNISDEYVRIQLPEKSTAISQEMLKQPMLERQEQQTPAQTMQQPRQQQEEPQETQQQRQVQTRQQVTRKPTMRKRTRQVLPRQEQSRQELQRTPMQKQVPQQQTKPRQTQQKQQGQQQKQRQQPIPKISEMELGDITDFLRDPYVNAVEYSDGKLKIITDDGEKEKGTLDEQEARKIIENFAKTANTQVKPSFEVILGNLKMTAVLSEILGVKFRIMKI